MLHQSHQSNVFQYCQYCLERIFETRNLRNWHVYVGGIKHSKLQLNQISLVDFLVEVRSTNLMKVLRIDIILFIFLVTFFATKAQYPICYDCKIVSDTLVIQFLISIFYSDEGGSQASIGHEPGQWVAKVGYFWRPMHSNGRFLVRRSTRGSPNAARNGPNAKKRFKVLRKDFFWRPMWSTMNEIQKSLEHF